MICPDDYIEFVRREYLDDFVRSGGAAVKFVVPHIELPKTVVEDKLRKAAVEDGYLFARVDAAVVKVHMIDQVFHAVARQVGWEELARTFSHETITKLSFRLPDGVRLPTLEEIARVNDYDRYELRKDFIRLLTKRLFRDYQMAQEFRIAMMQLCLAQVDESAVVQATARAVVEWLKGDLRRIVALKPAQIFQKVARHNARDMLFSLARWLRRTGHAGLVMELDIRRCSFARRTDVPAGSVHYSKSATLDAYEVLRQLIDATDELTSCFAIVTCAPEFLTDSARGVDGYLALKQRIYDDVRDKGRANPLAALVRLSDALPPETSA